MSIGPSIIEQEDALKNLPTQALQNMMRQPSPHAPPFLVAAELKRREDMAKEFAGKQAAAQSAQQAGTVADRLSGMQQQIPMSQAAAVAAPPQQMPMPEESRLSMAMSGATGQPPPELPIVNAEDGSVGELVKALKRGGVRTSSQMPHHKQFGSTDRPQPISPVGLAAIISAMQRASGDPKRAYGGLQLPLDMSLPKGKGMRSAARPVALAADGTGSGTADDIIQRVTDAESKWIAGIDSDIELAPQHQKMLTEGLGVFRRAEEAAAQPQTVEAPTALELDTGQADIRTSLQNELGRRIAARRFHRGLEYANKPVRYATMSPAEKSKVEAVEKEKDKERLRVIQELKFGEATKPIGGMGWIPGSEGKSVGHWGDKSVDLIDRLRWTSGIPQEQYEDEFNYPDVTPAVLAAKPEEKVIPKVTAKPDQVVTEGKVIPKVTAVKPEQVVTAVKPEQVATILPDVRTFPAKFPSYQTPPTEEEKRVRKTTAALRGRLTAVEARKAENITGQAEEFFKTLNEANKKIYSDLKTGLKKFEQADAKDFEKFESRVKALDDFYETGKLPERMRKDRITNLMLEMSKGLLGSQDLYSGFKAGLEGFQAVDKASRDEYAKGLAARLTASKGIMDSKMAMRNSRRQESIAMTKFAVAENRGNASLAMDQLKIAQQAKQNARTHEINLIRGEAVLLQADIAMVNATKGSEKERLLKSLPKDMYAAALAKANDGDRTELDKYYRMDSNGKVHANMPAFIALVKDMTQTRSTYQDETMRSQFDSQKVAFNTRLDRKLAPLFEGRATDNQDLWKAIAASAKIPLPKDKKSGRSLPIGPEWFRTNNAALRKAARLYVGRNMARQDDPTGRMRGWLEERGYFGQQGGAAQGEKRDPAVVRSGITGN